jgi:outer membrane protein OmpU
MNTIKKIGLSALAGSLVATSAYAGSMDVSGSAKINYVSKGKENVTGNPFTNSKGITFSGGGEIDNGWNVNAVYTMTDAAFSSSSVTIDMGDSGTFSLMNGVNLAGIGKYSDMMPTAGEQVWDDVDADDNGVVGTGNTNTLGYEASMMGMTVSASYARSGLGTDTSLVLVANDLIDGAQLGYGLGKDATSSGATKTENDHRTAWAKYTAGPATVGVQKSKIDKAAADETRTAAAISFAVNESLSISYGISDVDMEATTTDEESSGFSASYTMGGMTVGAVMNKTDNVAGSAGTDASFTEISVAFAF